MPVVSDEHSSRVLIRIVALIGLGVIAGFVLAGLRPNRPSA